MKQGQIPEYFRKAIFRAAMIVQATLYKKHGIELPKELRKYARVSLWKKNAANSLLTNQFKAFDPEHLLGRLKVEVMGYFQGMFKGLETQIEQSEMDDSDFEGLYIPDVSEEEAQEAARLQIEDMLGKLPVELQFKYYEGFTNGLKAVNFNESPEKEESHAQELYFVALAFSEDFKFLESWDDIYNFVISILPQFENRKDTMIRNFYRVGFRLKQLK